MESKKKSLQALLKNITQDKKEELASTFPDMISQSELLYDAQFMFDAIDKLGPTFVTLLIQKLKKLNTLQRFVIELRMKDYDRTEQIFNNTELADNPKFWERIALGCVISHQRKEQQEKKALRKKRKREREKSRAAGAHPPAQGLSILAAAAAAQGPKVVNPVTSEKNGVLHHPPEKNDEPPSACP